MSLDFPFLVLVLPFVITFIILLIPKVKANIDREKHKLILLGLVVAILGSSVLATLTSLQIIETRNLNFNGVIEQAYYEKPKHIPHITIKGVEYDLNGLNYGDYDTIKTGDSAIKKKGVFEFKLIKHLSN